jgi:hypothetical protein
MAVVREVVDTIAVSAAVARAGISIGVGATVRCQIVAAALVPRVGVERSDVVREIVVPTVVLVQR